MEKANRIILALFLLVTYFLYDKRGSITPYLQNCEWNERALFLDGLFYPFLEACKACNITYWLDCGGLLGAYRTGKLIPWDKDIDLAVLVDPPNEGSNISSADLSKFTCARKLLPAGTEQAFLLGHSGSFKLWRRDLSGELDVQLWYRDGSSLQMALGRGSRGLEQNLQTHRFEWGTIFPLTPIAFEGRFINGPHKPFKSLSAQYPFTVPYGIELPYKPACWLKMHPFACSMLLLCVLAMCALCIRKWKTTSDGRAEKD